MDGPRGPLGPGVLRDPMVLGDLLVVIWPPSGLSSGDCNQKEARLTMTQSWPLPLIPESLHSPSGPRAHLRNLA